jgi:hypothetical protein
LLFRIKLNTLYYTKTHRRQRLSVAISIRIPDELAAKLAVIARGINRQRIFLDDAGKNNFRTGCAAF